jgi:hypothetical protein
MSGPGIIRPDLCSIRTVTEQAEFADAVRRWAPTVLEGRVRGGAPLRSALTTIRWRTIPRPEARGS